MNNGNTFWLTVVAIIQASFILVGVIIFMITPKQGRREFWPLGGLLLASFLSDSIALAGNFLFHVVMNSVVNVMEFISFTCIVLLFTRHIRLRHVERIAYFILAIYLLFGFTNLLFIQGIHSLNSYTWAISSTCVIITCLVYFYLLLQELPTESITRLPMFWVTTAMLIYHSAIFFEYLAFDYLVKVLNNNLITLWIIHHLFGLVYYSILWYALILIRSEHQKRILA